MRVESSGVLSSGTECGADDSGFCGPRAAAARRQLGLPLRADAMGRPQALKSAGRAPDAAAAGQRRQLLRPPRLGAERVGIGSGRAHGPTNIGRLPRLALRPVRSLGSQRSQMAELPARLPCGSHTAGSANRSLNRPYVQAPSLASRRAMVPGCRWATGGVGRVGRTKAGGQAQEGRGTRVQGASGTCRDLKRAARGFSLSWRVPQRTTQYRAMCAFLPCVGVRQGIGHENSPLHGLSLSLHACRLRYSLTSKILKQPTAMPYLQPALSRRPLRQFRRHCCS